MDIFCCFVGLAWGFLARSVLSAIGGTFLSGSVDSPYTTAGLLMRIEQRNNFFDRPDMISYPRLHGRSDAESLMDTGEIVKHKVERNSVDMVLYLLGVRIGQTSKPAHAHAHLQVHTFNVAG